MPKASDKFHSDKFQKRCLLPVLLLLALCAGILLFLFFRRPALQREDYRHIASDTYDSALLSMYPVSAYHPEDFAAYRGLTLLRAEYKLPDASALEEYLERIARSGNIINTVYLGISPEKISGEELLDLLTAYPGVIFEILPEYPSLEYLSRLSPEEFSRRLSSYEALLTPLLDLENIHCYSFFAEEWFIGNPANYTDDFTVTEDISLTVMLNADREHPFLLTSRNLQEHLASLSALTEKKRLAKQSNPDLSDWTMVFFGDSIIANYKDSTSVPGVVAGLSQAATLNYAVGGSSASRDENTGISFAQVAEAFLEKNSQNLPEDDRLCFVINFGLNDYFNGYAPDDSEDPFNEKTYAGALRSGIALLKEAFPQARFLVMAPNFASYFSFGMEINSDAGGILADYAAAAGLVAKDMGALYLNNYTDLGITSQNYGNYLLDGCHLNEAGRFLLGSRIIELLGQTQQQNNKEG